MESISPHSNDSTAKPDKRKGPSWSGDPSVSPRCSARARSGALCRAPAMWSKKAQRYTRCRMHGGASSGPKTPAGLEKCRRSNWKHGERSAAAIAERRKLRAEIRELILEMKLVQREARRSLRLRQRLGSDPVAVVNHLLRQLRQR